MSLHIADTMITMNKINIHVKLYVNYSECIR